MLLFVVKAFDFPRFSQQILHCPLYPSSLAHVKEQNYLLIFKKYGLQHSRLRVKNCCLVLQKRGLFENPSTSNTWLQVQTLNLARKWNFTFICYKIVRYFVKTYLWKKKWKTSCFLLIPLLYYIFTLLSWNFGSGFLRKP